MMFQELDRNLLGTEKASTVSASEIGESITDTLTASTWKYFVYSATEASSVPLLFGFTLLSGDSRHAHVPNTRTDGV